MRGKANTVVVDVLDMELGIHFEILENIYGVFTLEQFYFIKKFR